MVEREVDIPAIGSNFYNRYQGKCYSISSDSNILSDWVGAPFGTPGAECIKLAGMYGMHAERGPRPTVHVTSPCSEANIKLSNFNKRQRN
jgi:hypothetical protein